MPITPTTEDWAQYRHHVISELHRISKTLEEIRAELNNAKTDIALLQLKSSAWGAIAGAVVAIGISIMRVIP